MEGVGFDPSSHLHVCDARVDIYRIKKRRGCKFSQTTFGFVEAHPHTLSVVTHLAFGPQGL